MHLLLINPWIYDFAAFDLWLKPLGLLYIASILKNLGCRIDLVDCLDRYHPEFNPDRTPSGQRKMNGIQANSRASQDSRPRKKQVLTGRSVLRGKVTKEKRYGCGNFYCQEVEKPPLLKSYPRKYKRYGIPLDIFRETLDILPEPALVLVTSGMTYWYPGVKRAVKMIKEKYPNKKIILGGTYATLCPEHAKNHSGADFVFKGGDIRGLVKLISEICEQEFQLNKVPKDFSQYPAPDYELYSFTPYIAIRTSTGCPYNCTYCGIKLITNGFIPKQPEIVVKEIEYFYREKGIKNFAFYDDALLFRKDIHLKKILRHLIERGVTAYFHTPNGLQARELDLEIAYLMREVEFVEPRLSLETINEERQKVTGGKVTNQALKSAVKNLVKAGYKAESIKVYIMIGLPGQGFKEIKESIQFVSDLGARPLLVEYSPIPGTREWEKSGLVLDPLLHNNTLFPVYNIKEWNRFQELKDLVRELNKSM